MTKEQIASIPEPVLSLDELVQKHIAQNKLRMVLESNLKTLQNDILTVDKQIFTMVDKKKSKHIMTDLYDVSILVTSKIVPGKTTYSYKNILEVIRKNYDFPAKWINRVYDKYCTTSKTETVKTSTLIISEIKQ